MPSVEGVVDWKDFVGKKIRILQKDGFKKDGILKGILDNFLVIEFSDGRQNLINEDFVASIKVSEVGKGGEVNV